MLPYYALLKRLDLLCFLISQQEGDPPHLAIDVGRYFVYKTSTLLDWSGTPIFVVDIVIRLDSLKSVDVGLYGKLCVYVQIQSLSQMKESIEYAIATVSSSSLGNVCKI